MNAARQRGFQEAARKAAEDLARHNAYLEQETVLNNQLSTQLVNDMVSIGRVRPLGETEDLTLAQYRAMMNMYVNLWDTGVSRTGTLRLMLRRCETDAEERMVFEFGRHAEMHFPEHSLPPDMREERVFPGLQHQPDDQEAEMMRHIPPTSAVL